MRWKVLSRRSTGHFAQQEMYVVSALGQGSRSITFVDHVLEHLCVLRLDVDLRAHCYLVSKLLQLLLSHPAPLGIELC